MCDAASFVVTEHREWWCPCSESHTDIRAYHGISDSGATFAKYTSVPVEVLPPRRDYSAPPETWEMRMDPDVVSWLLPEWWDRDDVAKRVMATFMEAWVPKKLVRGLRERVEAWEQVLLSGSDARVCTLEGQVWRMDAGRIDRVADGGTVSYMTGGCIDACSGTVNWMTGGEIRVLGSGGRVTVMHGTIQNCAGIVDYDGRNGVTIGNVQPGGIVHPRRDAPSAGCLRVDRMSGGIVITRAPDVLTGPVRLVRNTADYPVARVIITGTRTHSDYAGDRVFYDPATDTIIPMEGVGNA